MASVEDVRKLALELPEAEQGSSYGTPAWKVRKRLFARLLPDAERLAVFCDLIERESLLGPGSAAFELTDHYEPYEMVLIRIAAIDPGELAEMLTESWRRRAPKTLVAAYDAENPPAV